MYVTHHRDIDEYAGQHYSSDHETLPDAMDSLRHSDWPTGLSREGFPVIYLHNRHTPVVESLTVTQDEGYDFPLESIEAGLRRMRAKDLWSFAHSVFDVPGVHINVTFTTPHEQRMQAMREYAKRLPA